MGRSHRFHQDRRAKWLSHKFDTPWGHALGWALGGLLALAAALLRSFAPARRASRVDPQQALRQE